MNHEKFNDLASGIAAIASIVAIGLSLHTNYRLQKLEEKTLFVESLFNSIPHLANEETPSYPTMATHALYEVVVGIESIEEAKKAIDKIIPFLVASDVNQTAQSGSTSLNTLNDLCQRETNPLLKTYCQEQIKAEVSKKKDQALSNANQQDEQVQQEFKQQTSPDDSIEFEQKLVELSAKPSEGSSGVATIKIATEAKATTQEAQVEGWIYIGSTHRDYPTALDSAKLLTIAENDLSGYETNGLYRIPETGEKKYTLRTDVHLRDREPGDTPPGDFGEIIGILKTNSKVKIEELYKRRMDPNESPGCIACRRAVWARVTQKNN